MLSRTFRFAPLLANKTLVIPIARSEVTGLERYRKAIRKPNSNILQQKGIPDHHWRHLIDENSTTQLFFKKMQEPHHDFKMLPERGVLYAKRLRAGGESIVDLNKKGEVAGCIRKRDSYEEIDFVLPASTAATLRRSIAANSRQYLIKFPEGTEREVLCTMEAVAIHDHEKWPMKIYFQRFVVGAPNLIELPIVPYNTTINGSDLVRDQHIYSLFVWCYDTNYPSGIGINALSAFVHPNFTIGSLEQLLPPNVYLHERYRHSMDETVFEFPDTDTEDEDDYEGISNDAIHHELLQFRDDLKTGKYVNLFKDFLKKLREAKARGISFMANSEPSDEKATGKGIPPTTPQSEKDKEEKKRPSMMKPGPKRPGDVDRDQQALNDLKEQDVQPGVPPEPLETEKKKEKKIRKPKYATFLGLSKKGPKFDALKKALQAKAEKPKGTLDDLIPQEIREKSKQQGRSILSFVSEVKKKPPKPEPGMEGEKKPEEEKPKTEGKAKEEKGKVNKQKLMEALNMLKSNGKKTEAGKSQKKEVKKQPGNNKKPEKKEQKKEQAEKGEKKKEKKGE